MSAKTSLLLAAYLFAAVFPVPGAAHTLEEIVVVGRPIIEDNHVDRFASTFFSLNKNAIRSRKKM